MIIILILNMRLRLKENGEVRFTIQEAFGYENKDRPKLLDKPIIAHIRLTEKCNLKCPYCYAEGISKKLDMSDEQIVELIKMYTKERNSFISCLANRI